jgi:hypothetical protein
MSRVKERDADKNGSRQLAGSIAKIKRFEHAAKEKKQGYMRAVQSQLAPAAVLKLADKGGDVAKLTVKEMSSILFACYSIDMPPNKSGWCKET